MIALARVGDEAFRAPEEWRAIPGYEGRYEVSDQGGVRSLRRRGANRHGEGYDRARAEPLVLRLYTNREGRLYVNLGYSTRRSVHRLVLETFVGPCPPGHEGSHLDGQRLDNRLVNLAWETHAENMARRAPHGTSPTGRRNGAYTHPEKVARGEGCGPSKVTAVQVIEMRAAAARGETQAAIAIRYGLSKSAVGLIVRRRNWGHVP